MSVPTDRTTDGEPADHVERELLDFLAAKTRTNWEPDRDLFAAGGLSSLFVMELVVHLEKSFSVEIVGPDLRLDNFRSVRAMAGLVRRLQVAQRD
ncbi:acyl carrier protein [Saccharopolyspora sp. NPDC002578]